MTRHTFNRIQAGTRLLLATALLLFSGCSQKPETYQNPMLGYFKVPAPKILADKGINLIRELDSSGQAALFIPFLLAGYGHPSYSGIDPEMDIAVFGFQGSKVEETSYLLLVKAERDAKLIEQLMGETRVTVREWGPWLAIAEDEAVFDLVVSRKELLKIASAGSVYDFELTLLPQGLVESRKDLIADLLAAPELQQNKQARQWADALGNTFFDELESTESLIIGGNISGESIGWGLDLAALKGTPLGSLISAGSPGRVEGGKFLSADQSITYVLDYPTGAIRKYLETLVEKLEARLPDGDPSTTLLTGMHEDLDAFLEDWSGMGGGGYSLTGGKIQTAQVLLGDFDSNPVEAYLSTSLEILLPLIQQAEEDSDLESDVSFTPNAGEIAGVPYHWLHQSWEFPEEELSGSPNEIPAALTDQDVYFAVVEDQFVQVSSLEALETIILNVQKQRSVENSIMTRFSPEKNVWAQTHLDLVRYYLETMESIPGGMRNPLINTEELAKALQMLQGQELDPVQMTAGNDGTRLSFRMEIPLSTLKAAAEAFQNFEKNGPAPETPEDPNPL